MSMKGKVAIVAGGGRDIGRACALELAKNGANLVITYHSSSATALSAVAEIERLGQQAVAVKADLTSQSDVDKTVAAALDAFGSIDTLVHVSGGLVGRVRIDDMSLEHYNTVMNLNMTSLFMMTRACIPHLKSGS